MAAAETQQVAAVPGCASRKAALDILAPVRRKWRRNRSFLRKPNKIVPALLPAAFRGIVSDHRNAAGALISMELPLGRAQSISPLASHRYLEKGPFAPLSNVRCIRDSECPRRNCQLCSRRRSFRVSGELLAGQRGHAHH